MSRSTTILAAVLALAAAACGGADAPDAAVSTEASAVEATQAAPTGTVIEVKMITDDAGNRFEPAEITAKQGDVLRLTLVSGVHNLSFPADKNPAGAELPAATDYLQLPGQTMDVPVTMPAGAYAFQCDPHAALGMVGTLTVEN